MFVIKSKKGKVMIEVISKDYLLNLLDMCACPDDDDNPFK